MSTPALDTADVACTQAADPESVMTVRDTVTGEVAFLPVSEVAKDMRRYLAIVDDDGELAEVPLAAALAGMYLHGESLGPGTAACAVVQERALRLLDAAGFKPVYGPVDRARSLA